MNVRSTGSTRLKAFLVIEVVMGLIALVVPVTPSKTGAPFVLPPDIASYFQRVLLCFLLGNGILIVLAAAVWLYGVVQGRPSLTEEETMENASPLDLQPPNSRSSRPSADTSGG